MAEIADAANYPMIRLLRVGQQFNQTAQNRISIETKPWAEASSNNSDIGDFSAVCYFTARDTYRALVAAGQPVALGLVEAAWSGTRVEAWTRPTGISKGTTGSGGPNHSTVCNCTRGRCIHQNECSALFNGMVHPLLPTRFRFALWYQVCNVLLSALGV